MTTTSFETTLEGECAETGTPVYVDVRLHFDVEPASGDGWNEPRTRGGCTFTYAERLDTTPPQEITGGYLKRLADEFGSKHEEAAWCEWCEAQQADADEARERRDENRRERNMEIGACDAGMEAQRLGDGLECWRRGASNSLPAP